MSAQALEERTFITEHPKQLAPVLSFLEAHEQHRGTAVEPSYALVGVGEHDRIELPQEVHKALIQVVAAMLAGKAVTIAPRSMTLTSQQAADLLGVSRPTVKRIIEKGDLPAERIGTRHRLRLEDVLAYREARRQRQYDALAATAIDIDADEEPEAIREQLRAVRHAVAERRRAKG
ncbi:helix-turn-helix domain-containing protein [Nocardia sp. NBC_01009]|uniref:helix-turn-helix domain-containing protein n=1 Tax=Nocardia sp. NBC_01009 TaxID=2975996 RepID=UPI00386F0F7C|nr:excisionase family DNA-binding protein [Nocardia sp. NBC_01009]